MGNIMKWASENDISNVTVSRFKCQYRFILVELNYESQFAIKTNFVGLDL